MNVKNWLNFGRGKDRDPKQILNVNTSQSPTSRSVASGHLKAAGETLSREMEEQQQSIKILAVQDGVHSQVLTDYAVKMAHKLDCEIVALDVSDEPLDYDGERRQRETNRFYARANRSAETLQLKAEALGVKYRHIVRVGNQEEVIKALSTEDRSIRYVLTKPEQAQLDNQQRRARVQVFDLNCSRL